MFYFQNGDWLFLTLISLILRSTSSCIIYYFVAKQLLHLIWYPITLLNKPGNQLRSFLKGVKFVVFGFFHRERKMLYVFGNTTSYRIVWQMLLCKWIFSWLSLSSSTREERYKNSTFLRNFHGLHKTMVNL